MATQQEIDQINAQIKQLRKELGYTASIKLFRPEELKEAKLQLRGLSDEARELGGELDYIARSFKDAVNELSRQNIYLTSARRSLTGISDISRKLVDYRKNESSYSEKQLKDLQKKAKIQFNELRLIERQGNLQGNNLLEVQNALLKEELFNNEVIKTIKYTKEVNKEIGLFGSGLEGAGKFLSKLGFEGLSKPLSEAIEKTKGARLQYKLNQDAIKSLNEEYNNTSVADVVRRKELREQLYLYQTQNKELDKQTNKYKNIAIALKEQFTLVNMTDAILTKVVDSFFKLDDAQTKFRNLTGGTIPLLDQMNGRLIASVDYIQTAASLTLQTGMNAAAIFTPDTLASAAEMVKAMGMTQEQANKAAIMSQVNGQSIDQMNASIKKGTLEHNATNRSALAQGAIMREVYSTSTALAASLGNSTKKITEAAASAKDLGLNLTEVEGISNSLLDVQQSIASEFEYEVISGKQINLEAARYYALTNQTDKLMKEIGKNHAIVNSFASGNRIEQEAAAKAIGVSRDKLAEMYMADLRKQGLSNKAIADAMKMNEMDVKRLSLQESINTSISKMTELLAGPLEAMAQLISNAFVLKGIMIAIGGVIMTQMVLGVIEMGKGLIMAIPKLATILGLESGIAAAKISGAMAATVGLGAIAILGGITAGIIALNSAKSTAASSTVPGLAVGGTVTRAGSIMVGENGPEILSAQPGATVTPLNKVNAATITTPQSQSPYIDYDKLTSSFIKGINANPIQATTYFDMNEHGRRYQQSTAGQTARKI
jgi:hypothetical protein